MKTTKSLVLLAAIGLGIAGCRTPEGAVRRADKATPPDTAGRGQTMPQSASISPRGAQFYFPIENIDRQWQWQAARSNMLEYQWAVTVSLNGETYQFGFSLYCSNLKSKSVGSFAELLASGQVNIWKKNASGGYSMELGMTGITARRQGDGLLIQLTEPELLTKLLTQRPATFCFESVSATNRARRENVRGNYQ